MIERKISVGNVSVEIYYDSDSESPRLWSPMTKFVMAHKRYDLPNEIDFPFDDHDSWEETSVELFKDYNWVFPVYMLDHGGTRLSLKSFNDPWDSGIVGFICLSMSEASSNFALGTDWDDKARQVAEEDLEEYDNWMNGNVFGFRLFEETNEIECDQQWGFIGNHDTSGLMTELKSELKYKLTEEQLNQLINQL
jgi:hypothetical protein